MGNRILKDSILTSQNLNRLNWFEQVMFTRLIVSADDYGIFFADSVLLTRMLFPRDPSVTEDMIREGLDRMEKEHLIKRYTVKAEPYLQLVTWKNHQRLRESKKHHPFPEDADGAETVSPVSESALCATDGEPRNTAQPESAAGEPAVIELPLNDGTVYGVTQTEADEYANLYPAVDVMQQLRNMRGWCLSNPRNSKTRSGIRKFINSWLVREQNKGGNPQLPPENPFIRMVSECTGAEDTGGRIVSPFSFPEGVVS